HEDSAGRTWEGRVYGGQRQNLQYQALGAEGQWVGLDRDYYGLGLSASQSQTLASVHTLLTVGLESDYAKERRQGGAASGGEKSGAPTRDEDNIAQSSNAFFVGNFLVSERYSVTAGARLGEVRFESRDFIPATAQNADGSGKVRYSQFSPAFGVTRHVSPNTNVFVNYGRGFETPTLAEVAYASSSTGTTPTSTFNQAIRASENNQAEFGIKWRPDSGQRLSAVFFWVSSTDEIVTDQSAFGRTSSKNAPKTKRLGAELSWVRNWSSQWRSVFAASVIDATYDTAFVAGTTPIASGNKIPGIPGHVVFGEIEWAQSRTARSTPQGWSVGIEMQSVGRRYANDTNTLSADPFETVALRTGYSRTMGVTDLQFFARIDNLLDKKYVGSVIVNNASPFEPSPERNWMVGVKAVTRF
ncbi:MAG: TonB-dependent receptor domain-containing protein, partial [Burkholderiaceae bacterium]